MPIPCAPVFTTADHAALSAWTARNCPNGVRGFTLDEPGATDDVQPFASIFVRERPGDAAYLVHPAAGGWTVLCVATLTALGTAPDLAGALAFIRPDVPAAALAA